MRSYALESGRAVARSGLSRPLIAAAAAALLCVFLSLFCAGPVMAAPWYSDVSFVDSQHGWYSGVRLGGAVRMWRTSDGGRTLKELPARYSGAGAGGPICVTFISREVGIWWGFFGPALLRTTDGGMRWGPVAWPNLIVPIGVAFADATTGWATSMEIRLPDGGGEIARTTDGGATWNAVRVTGVGFYYGPASPSPEYCYVLGDGAQRGLWATSDGGSSWRMRALPGIDVNQWFGTPMAFPAELTGWLAGANGTIFKTTDGGESWTRQSSGTHQYLNALEFVDARYGWAVGGRGTILATRDGGAHWRRQSSGTTAGLEAADFVDRLHGWAVGGKVRLRTTDGGKTWKKL